MWPPPREPAQETWGAAGAWPVHAGPAVAAHPRLRAVGLGRRGRGVRGRSDRAPPRQGRPQRCGGPRAPRDSR